MVTKGLPPRRVRSGRWVRMRAGSSEAHAEQVRRPVLLSRVSSSALRSTAWEPRPGLTHPAQVTGPAARSPRELAFARSADRSGRARPGPGLSAPLSRPCAGSVWTPSPQPAGDSLGLLASPGSGPGSRKRGCAGGGTR